MKRTILTAITTALLTAFMVSLFFQNGSKNSTIAKQDNTKSISAIATPKTTATPKKKNTKKYVDCFRVCKVKGRKVFLEAQNGNVFVYKMSKKDMEEGVLVNELYAVRMDSKNTECVYDDEILETRYIGFLQDEEEEKYSWVKGQ